MPIMGCTKDGKPGYKYGATGYCYTYIRNNEQSRLAALTLAQRQRTAILASGYKEKKDE